MSAPSTIEEAAARLRQALEDNKLGTLQTSDFRIFINEASNNKAPRSTQQQLSEYLLAVLSSDQLSNNNLIVAGTAYCKMVSNVLQETELILEAFINVLSGEQFQEWTVFLCHGIFQLNCWKLSSKNGDTLLEEIFTVVKKICCELNSVCYLAFKVLNSLLNKIHELYPTGTGISEENFKSTLEIVLSNWENPLGGVRQQNSLVLNQLLLFSEDYWNSTLAKSIKMKSECKVPRLIRHQGLFELVLTELSWTMKSKYFLLSSIVQCSNVPQILSEYGEDIIEGLIVSLSIPYLVSAGTDLYIALVASLSVEDWQHWFQQPFIKVISQGEPSLEVENIFNYWMNPTLKKYPSIFDKLVLETKYSLFSFVTLQKFGRKEGLSKWENLDKKMILKALKHNSEKIRSQVILLVCTTSKTFSPPNDIEVDIIRRFLKENINSDDPALRQNLLKSLNNFMLRMRDSILHTMKLSKDNSFNVESGPLKICFSFLQWLHKFLIFNLRGKSNYQRKITSLEIYQMVFTCFGGNKGESDHYKRKSNTNDFSIRNVDNFQHVFKFESDDDTKALFNCLFDEDNSIRLSSANILISHYKFSESNKNYFEKLFNNGMALCKDQMFYKAESGALIIKVLVSLAYKSGSKDFETIINNGSDGFINALLSSAEDQFAKMREDFLKAASEGAFLYGTLQTIELLTSDSSIPELALNQDHIERLIKLIEEVTDYLISVLATKSDSPSDFAPSFGEMGTAIAAVVKESSVESTVLCEEIDNTTDELQLTPAQQLVLNCIWMNLKECTKLCSKLVSRDLCVRDSQRCVSVVVVVLKKCRHKGAIESAGLALYHICNHLTKSIEPELINLPEELLKDFLQMLVGTTAATVSRRSAGLAILVHRLITGDSRQKKPLLHLCVSRLLLVAEDSEVKDHTSLVDLPQSQALHFLRTLVQESSLREHMVQYMLNISLVAINSLASPLWTIRNAALQLFGALVPKLVGQKPNQEQEFGNYHLAFEELYTHAQPLVKLILKEFTSAANCSSITSHSRLMPLLTLVTNVTLGLQPVLTPDMMTTIHEFQQCFMMLFKSRIFNVRKLSSKASALFATTSRLVDMIEERATEVISYIENKECAIQSQNELHSYVLNVTHLFERFEGDKRGMKVLLDAENKVQTLLQELGHKLLVSAKCSYFTKALVFKLKLSTINVYRFLPKNSDHISKHALGFWYFIDELIKQAIFSSYVKDVVNIVESCLQSPYYNVQCTCLKTLVQYAGSNQNDFTFLAIVSILGGYLFIKKHNWALEQLIFEAMLCILECVKDESLLGFSYYNYPGLLSYCLDVLSSDETLITVSNVVLPITCALLVAQVPIKEDILLEVSKMIKAKSELQCDQDSRLSAAKSISFLQKTRQFQKNESGELIWRACIDLLQDEVAEVRYETSKFISRLVILGPTDKCVLNPFIALEYLFQPDVYEKLIIPKRIMPCLIEIAHLPLEKCFLIEKSHLPTKKKKENKEERKENDLHNLGVSNPFDHNGKRIFAEQNVVSKLANEALFKHAEQVKGLNEIFNQLLTEAEAYLPNLKKSASLNPCFFTSLHDTDNILNKKKMPWYQGSSMESLVVGLIE